MTYLNNKQGPVLFYMNFLYLLRDLRYNKGCDYNEIFIECDYNKMIIEKTDFILYCHF